MIDKKTTAIILGAIGFVMIVVILLVALLPTIDDDEPHNHFIGSGEIDFQDNTNTVKNFYDGGTITDVMGTGFNSTRKCLELSPYSLGDIIHFHHSFWVKPTTSSIIFTYLLKNETLKSVPSPIEINHSIANSPFSTFSNITGPDILTQAFSMNGNSHLGIDFHIPRTEAAPNELLHLVFIKDISFRDLKSSCPNCISLGTTDLEFLKCIENNGCGIVSFNNQLQIIRVIKFCGPIQPES